MRINSYKKNTYRQRNSFRYRSKVGIIPVFRTVPNHRSEGLSSWARFQHNLKPNATPRNIVRLDEFAYSNKTYSNYSFQY